jgi:hypothetical protein
MEFELGGNYYYHKGTTWYLVVEFGIEGTYVHTTCIQYRTIVGRLCYLWSQYVLRVELGGGQEVRA